MCKDEKKQGQNTFEYKAEGNKYVFVGNLEEYLREIGVDPEHIKDMQEKKLEESRQGYYDSCKAPEMELVPLNKVIGTSRGTVGKSVYDNVREINNEERMPLQYDRFERCFSFVARLGLESVRRSYKTVSTETSEYIRMDYYQEDDKYFVTSGNHRVLTAMLLDAPSIEAKVTTCKCDWEMKHKVESRKAFYKKYSIDGIYELNQKYGIIFREGKDFYRIMGFEARKNGEGLLAIMDRLQREIDGDLEVVGRIKRLPQPLKEAALKHCPNERIPQYFDCKKLSEADKRYYDCYSVTLEKFGLLSDE